MKPRSTPTLRARMKEEARAAILDAAEQVLAEQGLSATRMEDIAARVGVAVGTLYNYFEDRERLLRAILDLHEQRLLAGLDAALEHSAGTPYPERLRGLLRAILEHTLAHWRLFSLLVHENGPRRASASEELTRHQRLWREVSERVERLHPEGVAQGALRPEDVAHFPTLLLGMLQGLILRQVIEEQPPRIEELLGVLLRCFLEGARPRPA